MASREEQTEKAPLSPKAEAADWARLVEVETGKAVRDMLLSTHPEGLGIELEKIWDAAAEYFSLKYVHRMEEERHSLAVMAKRIDQDTRLLEIQGRELSEALERNQKMRGNSFDRSRSASTRGNMMKRVPVGEGFQITGPAEVIIITSTRSEVKLAIRATRDVAVLDRSVGDTE